MKTRFLIIVTGLFLTSYANGQSLCSGPMTVNMEGSTTGLPFSATWEFSAPECVDADGQYNGSIAVIPTGGSPEYFYYWTQNGAYFGQKPIENNLGPGVYEIVASDVNGCGQTLGPLEFLPNNFFGKLVLPILAEPTRN